MANDARNDTPGWEPEIQRIGLWMLLALIRAVAFFVFVGFQRALDWGLDLVVPETWTASRPLFRGLVFVSFGVIYLSLVLETVVAFCTKRTLSLAAELDALRLRAVIVFGRGAAFLVSVGIHRFLKWSLSFLPTWWPQANQALEVGVYGGFALIYVMLEYEMVAAFTAGLFSLLKSLLFKKEKVANV